MLIPILVLLSVIGAVVIYFFFIRKQNDKKDVCKDDDLVCKKKNLGPEDSNNPGAGSPTPAVELFSQTCAPDVQFPAMATLCDWESIDPPLKDASGNVVPTPWASMITVPFGFVWLRGAPDHFMTKNSDGTFKSDFDFDLMGRNNDGPDAYLLSHLQKLKAEADSSNKVMYGGMILVIPGYVELMKKQDEERMNGADSTGSIPGHVWFYDSEKLSANAKGYTYVKNSAIDIIKKVLPAERQAEELPSQRLLLKLPLYIKGAAKNRKVFDVKSSTDIWKDVRFFTRQDDQGSEVFGYVNDDTITYDERVFMSLIFKVQPAQ